MSIVDIKTKAEVIRFS